MFCDGRGSEHHAFEELQVSCCVRLGLAHVPPRNKAEAGSRQPSVAGHGPGIRLLFWMILAACCRRHHKVISQQSGRVSP